MATKAEWFRYESERAGPKKAPAVKRPSSVAVMEEKIFSEPHNLATRPDKKALYVLEDTAGRPSRKSTRKSSNHQKTDAQFRMKRTVSEVRPEDRPRIGHKR